MHIKLFCEVNSSVVDLVCLLEGDPSQFSRFSFNSRQHAMLILLVKADWELLWRSTRFRRSHQSLWSEEWLEEMMIRDFRGCTPLRYVSFH
jgi:hypothetical protein